MNRYSLAHLTALGLTPPQIVDAAAAAGYDHVGLRLNRTTPEEPLYDLARDRAQMRQTQARLAATGVTVWDIEVARMDPERDHLHYQPFLEAGAELGARQVIAQLPDPDRARAVDRFARLCEMAAPLGLTVALEFVSWSQTPDLQEAAHVLHAAGQRNAGILVDMLHFDRSHSSLQLLRALPRHWFTWVHACDAPAQHPDTLDGLIHQARRERQLPGQGGIDVDGIVASLPQPQVFALEIPNESVVARCGYQDYVSQCIRAARHKLEGARREIQND